MRRLSLLLAPMLAAACATAPGPDPGYLEVLEGATRVTCRGTGMEGEFGSRLARSAMLEAPAGDRAAWVEIEAQALRDGADDGTCQNVSRLWIREGETTFVAFVQRPGWEGKNGNAIDLVDWSSDGSKLLLELHTWTYPTDPADPTLLVWDAATRTLEQADAAARFAQRLPEDCAIRVRGAGFTREGVLVVRLDDGAGNMPPCAGNVVLWRVPGSGDLSAESAIPARWSRSSSPPPAVAPIDPD